MCPSAETSVTSGEFDDDDVDDDASTRLSDASSRATSVEARSACATSRSTDDSEISLSGVDGARAGAGWGSGGKDIIDLLVRESRETSKVCGLRLDLYFFFIFLLASQKPFRAGLSG
jgi:hypothetical protein